VTKDEDEFLTNRGTHSGVNHIDALSKYCSPYCMDLGLAAPHVHDHSRPDARRIQARRCILGGTQEIYGHSMGDSAAS
jgi:hypothetical protein